MVRWRVQTNPLGIEVKSFDLLSAFYHSHWNVVEHKNVGTLTDTGDNILFNIFVLTLDPSLY